MNDVKQQKTYKCPHCGGEMLLTSGGKKFYSYVCDICSALLMLEIREELQKVNIGGVIISIDNKEVAKILKKEFKQ